MKNKHHYVAIMAGGIGSRFWPMSRTSFPKQFLDVLNTGKTLIQWTYDRYTKFIPEENIFIVTSEEYVDIVKKQLPNLPVENILAEPSKKNTAPCIAYISFKLAQIDPEASFIVAPSDHLILEQDNFEKISLQALDFVANIKALATLGIKPTHPNTGYGYIQYEGLEVATGIYKVKTFTEKPDLEIAKSFLASGDFLWNAGIFVWSLNAIANRFEHLLPEIHQLFSELDFNSPNISNELEITYGQCPSISIDYGIMEKDKNVFVLPSNFGWSDLGTWKSLWDVSKKDSSNNSLIGNNIRAYQSSESLVFSNNEKLLVISGLENVVVVDSDDVLLIMNKDKEQELRNIVNEIKDKFKGKYN